MFQIQEDVKISDNHIYESIYVKLQTLHVKETHEFYFNIRATLKSGITLIDDVHYFKNVKFGDIEQELDFYNYLRCITDLTISDVGLSGERIYLIGPTGLVNSKYNHKQGPVEEYYLKNKSKYYNTIYKRFLIHLNDKIIQNKSPEGFDIIKSHEDYFNRGYGFKKLIQLNRKYKHGSFKFDTSELPIELIHKSYLYQPSSDIIRNYNLNYVRHIFYIKDILNKYKIMHDISTVMNNINYDIIDIEGKKYLVLREDI